MKAATVCAEGCLALPLEAAGMVFVDGEVACRVCGGPPAASDETTICRSCWNLARAFARGRGLRTALTLREQLDLAIAPLGMGKSADSGFRWFEILWRKKPAKVKVDDCGAVSVRRGVLLKGVRGPGGGALFVVETGHGLVLVVRRPGSGGVAVPWGSR